MKIKLVYDESSEDLVDKLPEGTELYTTEFFKDKKKASEILYYFGTTKVPFCAIYDDDGVVINAFYSENKECTADKINKYLEEWKKQ